MSTLEAIRAVRAERDQSRLREAAQQAQATEAKMRHEAEQARDRERIIRARLLFDAGAFDEAEKLLSGVSSSSVEATIQNIELLHVLSDWNVIHGRWREAADALALCCKLAPPGSGNADTISRDFVRLSCLLIELDDIEAYGHLRQDMLAQSGIPQDYLMVFRIAQVALLQPVDSETAARIAPYVSKVREMFPEWASAAWRNFLFALFEYRQGQYAAAIELGQDAVRASGQDAARSPTDSACAACAFAVLAGSHRRLNHPTEARGALAQCQALAAAHTDTAKNIDLFWHDWMMAGILQREAQTLIEGQTDPASNQAKGK
jgi:hypothetical protein